MNPSTINPAIIHGTTTKGARPTLQASPVCSTPFISHWVVSLTPLLRANETKTKIAGNIRTNNVAMKFLKIVKPTNLLWFGLNV